MNCFLTFLSVIGLLLFGMVLLSAGVAPGFWLATKVADRFGAGWGAITVALYILIAVAAVITVGTCHQ